MPFLFGSVLTAPLSVFSAPAQGVPPDAGQILKEIERDLEVKPVPPRPLSLLALLMLLSFLRSSILRKIRCSDCGNSSHKSIMKIWGYK
jgi:hypothetical protein